MSKLRCFRCGKKYGIDSPIWRCGCGSFLDVADTPAFSISSIEKDDYSLWRYRAAIPVMSDKNIVTLGEGWTPMIELSIFDLCVFVKVDYLFPTGSFKDRGATVVVSKMKQLGISRIVEDSSGNAGAAMAAYSAAAGIRCDVYVPERASQGKLRQMRAYGANVVKVAGSRDDTATAAVEAAKKSYYAGHSWNCFFLEGTKTFSYEICEQLNWQAPDCVILPVGSGTLILGAYKGFQELYDAKVISKMPRLIAVQAKVCAPLLRAFQKNLESIAYVKKGETVAEGISIAKPIRGVQMLRAVRSTGGTVITVSDAEIIKAQKMMGMRGFYAEPTGAVGIAGVKKALDSALVDKKEKIVVPLTGSGLKAD